MRKQLFSRRGVLKAGAAGAAAACVNCGPGSSRGGSSNTQALQPLSGMPVAISAQIDLPKQGTAAATPQALAHPSSAPMEVHCISFCGYSSDSTSTISGVGIGAKISLGKYVITNNFVPLSALTRATAQEMEIFGNSTTGFCAYRWVFDRPLYVAPGEAIAVSLENRGLMNDSATMFVTLSGITVPPRRKFTSRFIPYAASYTSSNFNMSSATALSDVSPETALTNSTSYDVAVTRLIGRLSVGATESPGSVGGVVEDIGAYLIDLRMYASDGFAMVKHRTPFCSVFRPGTRTWEMNHTLRPGEFYKVRYDTSVPPSPLTDGSFAQTHVCLQGYYEVRV